MLNGLVRKYVTLQSCGGEGEVNTLRHFVHMKNPRKIIPYKSLTWGRV